MSIESRRQWVGIFAHEDDILSVTRDSRERGIEIVDVYSPYAIHGLDRAMGLRPSRLTWVCFLCGLLGGAAMLWFATWTLGEDWPVNIGGKPYNSLPAIIPVVFETVILLGGYCTVFALLWRCRLYPGKKTVLVHPQVTDDRFAIVLQPSGAEFAPEDISALLEEHGAVEVDSRVQEVPE